MAKKSIEFYLCCFIITLFTACVEDKKVNCNEVSCPYSYVDSVFKVDEFCDSIKPHFGIKLQLSKKCYILNNFSYKHLLIIDSLYNNDTILSEFLRSEKHIIYGYNFSLKKEYVLVDLQTNNFSNSKMTFSPIKFVSAKGDTILNYNWIGHIGESQYVFQFSKKDGLNNIYRTYGETLLDL